MYSGARRGKGQKTRGHSVGEHQGEPCCSIFTAGKDAWGHSKDGHCGARLTLRLHILSPATATQHAALSCHAPTCEVLGHVRLERPRLPDVRPQQPQRHGALTVRRLRDGGPAIAGSMKQPHWLTTVLAARATKTRASTNAQASPCLYPCPSFGPPAHLPVRCTRTMWLASRVSFSLLLSSSSSHRMSKRDSRA